MMEFGAKLSLKDNMLTALRKNIQEQQKFKDAVTQTGAELKKYGNMKANPTVGVNDQASGMIAGIKKTVSDLSQQKALTKAEVQDEASKKMEEILKKVREAKTTVASPVIKLRDLTSSKVGQIKQKLNDIATQYTPIVKIRDMATQGISKLKNTLGGLGAKTIMTAVKLKDGATSGINKIRVSLATIGKMVTKPFITVKDKASSLLGKVSGSLKSIGKTVAKPFISLKDGATKILTSVKSGLKSVGSMVAKPMIAVKDGASAVLGKMGGMLKTLAKGATIAIGVTGAGLSALVGGSLSQGASLEQSIGGVETLFKDDAGVVKANADSAFKTAGLSANAYMEQVTSFSASLLQSLGGDTAKSASVADMAIVDMADNANKMGTSVDLIQNAYQGFAKQNYTMLDNLKLGYGGTQEEMARLLTDATKFSGVKYDISNLADVYSAINVIQTNLGITGTTAKEASETFSGSFASMKASAQNLLGNLAIGGDVTGSMEELVETASTFLFNNAIPMIGNVLSALPSAIKTGLAKASPKIKEAGGAIVQGLKDGMKAILPSSMGGLVDPLFDGLGKGISGSIGRVKSILTGLAPIVTNVITTMAPVVGEIGAMFDRVAPVVQSALAGAFGGESGGFIQGFADIVKSALPVVEKIISSVAQTIGAVLPSAMGYIQSLGNVFQAVMPIVSNLITIFSSVIQTVFPIVYNLISTVLNAVMPIITAFSGLIQSAMPIVEGIIQTFSNVVATIFPVVQTIFQGLGDKIAEIVGVVTSHMGLIQGVFETVSPIIQSAVEIIGTVLSAMWDIVSPIMDLAISIFDALLSCVEAVFPVIQSTIETVWSVLEPIFGGIAKGLGAVGDAISGVASFVGSGVDAVKGALGFAYGKDRVPYDNYPAVLHQGEKVLTRNQADQYERASSTRGVQISGEATPVKVGGSGDNTGGVTQVQTTQAGGDNLTFNFNFPDMVVRKEEDIETLADRLVGKITERQVSRMKKLLPGMI